jgi:hypothetical protein
MNYGKVKTSARLQMTLSILLTGPKTTREIREFTDSCAVNSDISALRMNGYEIDCTPTGRSKSGNKTYLYTLRSSPREHVETVPSSSVEAAPPLYYPEGLLF